MSTSIIGGSRTVGCRSLREYVELLYSRLNTVDSAAAHRIRRVVGARRARITLDEESVDVYFSRGRLHVTAPGKGPVDGTGRTTRQVTLDLIDGYLEITTAVLDGRLELTGSLDAIVRMDLALEVLLDSATRAPALQQLAQDFRDDPCRAAPAPRSAGPFRRWTPFYSDPPEEREHRLLEQLDLLP